ncbi:extracellular signal-regulated kinase 1/2 [Strigomonas culicis]|uniref:Extracellular signal-regulated kinase 1/2 n=1 Tax=Strigomonas culicis TaxID=28005 RepID=S9WDB2_9TRYP|nr:extracellular signal-regulated kinase 1/2 [Strigomonas culicis]EPY37096.1 extracellular signal-regulated kinase 1/2 [Strigomonas culicis]|eukprot:EPY28603.1 extracellular signal-regulated kinase 1/2 [Strigomonas culicis]
MHRDSIALIMCVLFCFLFYNVSECFYFSLSITFFMMHKVRTIQLEVRIYLFFCCCCCCCCCFFTFHSIFLLLLLPSPSMPASSATMSLADFQREIDGLAPGRYTLERTIGAGSYGVVIRAVDRQDGNSLVAIKRVNKEIFDEVILAKRILREIKLLAHFDDENIIGLKNVLTPQNEDHFEHFYIIMNIMETDLRQVLRSGQQLTEAHIQFFLYQALRALHIIHSAGVIHRDITPANILVNTNCDLKICDFGLAKEESDQGEYMTDYVTMRWYRAPELVMEDKKYSTQIDVWGLGCILGELLGSRPLFQGKDRVNQLDKIVDIIGTPSEADIDAVGSAAAQKYIKKKGMRPPPDWRARYPNASHAALDLLARMLVFNPNKRITVLEAMRHPFLADLHDTADDHIHYKLFAFNENEHKNIKDVKRAIYVESIRFHQQGPAGGEVVSSAVTAAPSVACSVSPAQPSPQPSNPSSPQPTAATANNNNNSNNNQPLSVTARGDGRSAQQTIEKDVPENENDKNFDR